jgi:Holliday junction resolvase
MHTFVCPGWGGGSKGDLGAAYELVAASDLIKRGFAVFRNLSPNGFIDLLAIKKGAIYRVQVKGGASFSNQELRSNDIFVSHVGGEIKYQVRKGLENILNWKAKSQTKRRVEILGRQKGCIVAQRNTWVLRYYDYKWVGTAVVKKKCFKILAQISTNKYPNRSSVQSLAEKFLKPVNNRLRKMRESQIKGTSS